MTTTQFWLIRHAPVRENNGVIYGAQDWSCATNAPEQFAWLAEHLPNNAKIITSGLKRTQQTAHAVLQAGYQGEIIAHLPEFNEQSFGAWEGMTHAEVAARYGSEASRFWMAPALSRPADAPDRAGESFWDLCLRARQGMNQLLNDHQGEKIVIFAHGGTIRALLAHAYGMIREDNPALSETIFATQIETLSLSRIEHIHPKKSSDKLPDYWQVRLTNARKKP